MKTLWRTSHLVVNTEGFSTYVGNKTRMPAVTPMRQSIRKSSPEQLGKKKKRKAHKSKRSQKRHLCSQTIHGTLKIPQRRCWNKQIPPNGRYKVSTEKSVAFLDTPRDQEGMQENSCARTSVRNEILKQFPVA